MIAAEHPSGQPAPATEPALDIVFIEGLRGHTVIGIDAAELHATQPVVIDVHAGVPRAHACSTDRIGDTIDYGAVRARLLRLLAEHRHRLLEAFAEDVARILVHEFRAAWVRVKVAKPRKFDDLDAVGVQIERSAAQFDAEAPSHAQRGAAVLRLIASGMVPERG